MTQYIYRSAKTGRIVTEKWAKKHPATTVREKVINMGEQIEGYKRIAKSMVKPKNSARLILSEVSVKRSVKRKFPIREEVFYATITFIGSGNTFDVKTAVVVKTIMEQAQTITL